MGDWAIYMIFKRLLSQNSRVQNANLCHKFQFGHFNLRCTVNFHFSWWRSLERNKIEWERGKDVRNMRPEVRKSIEFSLPQAQVFYISSRNKTTNLSLSSFIPSSTPISSATIIPISSWSGLTTKTNTPGPKFPHGDSTCRGWQQTMLKSSLTITPMIKYSKFETNIQ